MDEYTAWQNFTETGKVSDYLAYCRVKFGYPAEAAGFGTEEYDERGNRRPDNKGKDDKSFID